MTGLAAVEKLNVDEDFFEKEYKERLTRSGPIKFCALLINDSYKGLDQFTKKDIMVLERSDLRPNLDYCEEDLEAIKEKASIFESKEKSIQYLSEENGLSLLTPDEEDVSELQRKLKMMNLKKASNQLRDKCDELNN